MICINGNEIKKGCFPNNETWIDKKSLGEDMYPSIYVYFKYENDADLIHLDMIKKHLDNNSPVKNTYLTIAYMPYSRMDRQNDNYIFSLKYICEFINSLNFTRITVYEPHSDVTSALLNNCTIINQTEKLFDNYQTVYNNIDIVYYPDAGAQKRYDFKLPFLVGNKKRDFKTGEITGLYINDNEDINNKNVAIVDDLCSAGGSFYYPAKILKERGAKQIILFVAHCEDNIFNGKLLKTNYVDKIITTDSILTKKHNKIEIIKNII